MKEVLKIINKSDIVIEVVDARVPLETRSKEIERYAKKKGKKLMIVIAKADLVPEGFLREIQKDIEEEGIPCVYISNKSRKGLRKFREVLKKIARGIKKNKVFACVVGYANTGKSSFINTLKGKHVTETAPIPGWTKRPKLIRITRWLYVFDTPGVIPTEGEKAEILGLIRADKIKDPVSIATKLLGLIAKDFPEEIKRIYKLEEIPEDPLEILREIARRMGRIKKGGELDLETTARKIITDWYSGRIRAYFKKIDIE